MRAAAYYNEIDPFAAEWLRNLIKKKLIAQGAVDDRSIRDVAPEDLKGFTQCHFFAGIGVWSHALRRANWPDDQQVWTGSCPCQPFSQAGRRGGFDDERHLWPEWYRLIRRAPRRPVAIFGEQVSGPDGLAWIDSVFDDLERESYAAGALDLCAAGVGAPHIRQRLYFMAYAAGKRRYDRRRQFEGGDSMVAGRAPAERGVGREQTKERCLTGRLADTIGERFRGSGSKATRGAASAMQDPDGERQRFWPNARSSGSFASGLLGDADDEGSQRRRECARPGAGQRAPRPSGATRGFWRGAVWIPCLDGRRRPIEPGTFPLAHGAAARVGRLRAYGNAIAGPLAAEFIRAAMEVMP